MRQDNITVVYKLKTQAEKSLWFDCVKMANAFADGIKSLPIVEYVILKEGV